MKKINWIDMVVVPTINWWLEEFKESVKTTMKQIFWISVGDKKAFWLEQFLENWDHGAEHVFNVFKKDLEIADVVEKRTGVKIDRTKLFIMTLLHDSGRFRMIDSSKYIWWDSEISEKHQTKVSKFNKNSDSKHEYFWTVVLKNAVEKLRNQWYDLDDTFVEEVREYVYNHDYMTPHLNGDRFQEPKSLEWQIARLADRISTSVIEEIDRYWATWKRMWTQYFNPSITFEERKDFKFSKIGDYFKAWKLDQFMFFATLLAVKKEDFKNPVLQEIYAERAPEKKHAADHIVQVARDEWFDSQTIEQIKQTLTDYSEIYDFDF